MLIVSVITDIKRQKRSADRFSVYVDGTFAFGLSDLDLSISGLTVGQEMSPEEVSSYQEQSGCDKAYNAALRYLGVRPHSRWEMQEYLRRKDFAEEAEGVVERLERAGLLDDRVFAEGWVAERQALRPRSRRRLWQELAAKGVAREIVDSVLQDNVPEDSELAAVQKVIEKKQHQAAYSDPNKLAAYLMRQGYSYDVVKKALARLRES